MGTDDMDVISSADAQTADTEMRLRRTSAAEPQPEMEPDAQVAIQRDRVEVAQTLQTASTHGDAGEFSRAPALLSAHEGRFRKGDTVVSLGGLCCGAPERTRSDGEPLFLEGRGPGGAAGGLPDAPHAEGDQLYSIVEEQNDAASMRVVLDQVRSDGRSAGRSVGRSSRGRLAPRSLLAGRSAGRSVAGRLVALSRVGGFAGWGLRRTCTYGRAWISGSTPVSPGVVWRGPATAWRGSAGSVPLSPAWVGRFRLAGWGLRRACTYGLAGISGSTPVSPGAAWRGLATAWHGSAGSAP